MVITMVDNEKSISWEIKEHLAVLKETPNGWKKELNIVSWNEGPAKFDIREWNPDHTHMTRGLTFNMGEARTVCDAMHDYLERPKDREARPAKEYGYER